MNFGGVVLGLFFAGIGGSLVYVFTEARKLSDQVSPWWLYIGVPILILGAILLWTSLFPTRYYCANCGQYLGFETKSCRKCGSNRWTTTDKGIGETYRNGGYNK